MIKILIVFGTRPEAIKMAPLVHSLKKEQEFTNVKVCVTGQHREMLDQVLSLFDLVPDFDLSIMKEGQDLYDVTSAVLLGMRNVFEVFEPQLVLVHGDTSTSMSASLAAYYRKIAVGHVEAGLRTNNIYSPWPEELNRQLTGRIANYHFCPTESNRENLLKEGIKDESIFITGNTVIDALKWVLDKINNSEELRLEIVKDLVSCGIHEDNISKWINKKSRKLILITGHRRENFGDGFINICEAIKKLASDFPDIDFVYPMHLNPNVRKAIKQVFGSLKNDDIKLNNITFLEPLDYLPFIYLMNTSYFVLTDSGGIQEEAPGLGKPVLVMRDNTERPEAVKAGTVKLVGTNKDDIIEEVSLLLNDYNYYTQMSQASNPYGDGYSSVKITEIVKSFEF